MALFGVYIGYLKNANISMKIVCRNFCDKTW